MEGGRRRTAPGGDSCRRRALEGQRELDPGFHRRPVDVSAATAMGGRDSRAPPHGRRRRGGQGADQGGALWEGYPMIAADFDGFFEGLQRVAIVCGRQKLMPDVAKTYFAMLEDLPVGPLLRAMDKFARTAETGRRFPSPRELREWVSTGGVAGLSDEEATRVWVRVARAMREWEREGSVGSAWPTFELAWQAACREEGVARRASPQNRQDCWQRWLSHGAVSEAASPVMTREDMAQICREVAPRCSPLFLKVVREIGERAVASR